MRYDSPVVTLLESAEHGMESAWREIYRRYSPLVLSVCRHYGIVGADADDVSGQVWLHLVQGLSTIREPAALPGWLTTTASRQCLRLLKDKRRQIPSTEEILDQVEPQVDNSLLAEERRTAVRDGFVQLSERDQKLLAMLFSDPPTPYADISSTLGMPIGAIGPTRRRCLSRVRRTPAIAALFVDDCHGHTN